MLLLPLLTALLGCASAFQPPVPDHECRTLDNVFHAVDTVAEAAVHASASGLVALYVCRRRGGPDCELVGGLGASSAASLFLVLKRVGGTLLSGDNGGGGGGGFGWFSVDDGTYVCLCVPPFPHPGGTSPGGNGEGAGRNGKTAG